MRYALIVLFSLVAVAASAETYIVPMHAQALQGSDGFWSSQLLAVNSSDVPVTLEITRVFPLITVACSQCVANRPPVTIPPHGTAIVIPNSGQTGRGLIAGAFEVTTSAPLHLHLVAMRTGEDEVRQRLDVARSWLLPGTRTISTVEQGGADWRMNAFIVNPGTAPLHVAIWTGNRAETEVRTTVAPGAMAIVGVPRPLCGGVTCPVIDIFPPPHVPVHLEANGVFLASVSSLEPTWAVFSLADESLIAR